MIKIELHVQPVPNWLFNVEIKAVMYYIYMYNRKVQKSLFQRYQDIWGNSKYT